MSHPSHIKSQVTNHPPKGSYISVEPIRRLEDIEAIKRLLKNNPRDYLLFTLGINNGLRAGDLLQLKTEQFRDTTVGSKVRIIEQKRGKLREIIVNQAVKNALDRYFTQYNSTNGYLFRSRKGLDNPITVSRANALVKSWCKQIGLQGNYGSHTLRKTFGTILRTAHNISWEELSKAYNHSSPKDTMRYLGVQDERVHEIIMGCNI